jgi:tetratricopeptide (TPR) repeat protein
LMFDPCHLVKRSLNRTKEMIPSLKTIERKSLSVLKIMIIFLLISFLITVISWILNEEEGISVQPFETVGLGENVDGKSLATLLSHDLQRIKDIYEPMREITVDSKSYSGNLIISRPLEELSLPSLSVKRAVDTPMENSLSQVVILGTMGTSLSIGSLLYPLKEFLGNKANTISCSLQRYNSSVVAVAILEEHQSSESDIAAFEHCANISNVEQIPSLVEDLAFMIALELSKRRSQNKEDLYPQAWQTYKYVTQGREAYNNYKAMRDISYIGKINYLDKGKNMALSAIEFEPGYKGSFELLSVLGFAYLEMGEYEDALKIFKNTTRFKPFESSLGLGLAYGIQGHYVEALNAFDNAIQQNSRYADIVWNYKGIILSKQGNHIEAARAFENATRLNPQNEIAWKYLGDSLAYLGRNNSGAYDEAIWAYEKAIELNSKDETAWKNKGFVLHRQGKYGDAVKAYKEIIKMNSSNAAAWQSMAASLHRMGKEDEALIAYNTSLQIDSNLSRKMQASPSM